MTVKELIDKLQQFDEDKLVLVEDTEYKESCRKTALLSHIPHWQNPADIPLKSD